MKKIATLLVILISTFGFAQELLPNYVFLGKMDVKADTFVGIDKFGFSYLISSNTLLKVKDQNTTEYKNVALGKITRVDIENPLLIVLFYESFNTVVLLDNQMNEIKQIKFSEIKGNIIVAHAVGLASQNRLWVFDSMTQQIGLYDYARNIYQSVTTPLTESISWYQTEYNNFVWTDSKGLAYRCDVFGKIQNLGNLPSFKQLQFISESAIVYYDGANLFFQELGSSPMKIYSDVNNSFQNFYYKDQILSIFTSGEITNYQIKIP